MNIRFVKILRRSDNPDHKKNSKKENQITDTQTTDMNRLKKNIAKSDESKRIFTSNLTQYYFDTFHRIRSDKFPQASVRKLDLECKFRKRN